MKQRAVNMKTQITIKIFLKLKKSQMSCLSNSAISNTCNKHGRMYIYIYVWELQSFFFSYIKLQNF